VVKLIPTIVAVLGVIALSSDLAFAQHRDDHRYRQDQGHEWRHGEHVDRGEWRSARRLDYREYHLRRLPRGYEWRAYDGRYILAAIATGVIVEIIMNAS
jgi:Ni/Co efflux regulator RcnB